MPQLSRRTFLRAAGVTLSLPLLDAMKLSAAAAQATSKQRMVCIMTPLGIHSEYLVPTTTGSDYQLSQYLEPLAKLRRQFTVVSGLSHPDVDGGHDAERSFLTGAPHPGQSGFRNTISVDQFAAEQLGPVTRFPSLVLNTMQSGGISWTRGGVQIPGEGSPSRLFKKMFLDGTQKEVDAQVQKLREGQSIMDMVNSQAKSFARGLGRRDQDKLDEYFTSVRDLEKKLVKNEEWAQKPKPKVNVPVPVDIQDNADLIGRTRMTYDLMHLAIQTDSTRLITLQLQGNGLVVPIPGVTIGHHGLSHHGKDPEKLHQLGLVEGEEFKVLGEFLEKLQNTTEEGQNLLDRTMVYFGSNMGNASSHDNRNMPVFFAGGNFKHGQHLAFDPQNPPPLCNLYAHMLQKLGVEVDGFASSKSVGIPGLV